MDRAFSCVDMLDPLLTQALADDWNERQPNPDPGVPYMQSAWKSWDHMSCLSTLTDEWHTVLWACAHEHLCMHQVKPLYGHSAI